jgi:hypothetical protein
MGKSWEGMTTVTHNFVSRLAWLIACKFNVDHNIFLFSSVDKHKFFGKANLNASVAVAVEHR